MTDTYVRAVLAEVEQGAAERPERLRARAEELMADYGSALAPLPRLVHEMGLLRGLAGALEQAEQARAVLDEAEAAETAAAEAYAATAGPEAEATAEAVRARQAFDRARDDVVQAEASGASPTVEVDLETAAIAAARVDERRLQVLARAQEARVLAKRDLDRARARSAQARVALAAAEAAVDAPAAAPRPAAEQVGNWCSPGRSGR